jgi:hypothetical protein
MTIKLAHLEFDHVVYDADSDVLYMSVGEPGPLLTPRLRVKATRFDTTQRATSSSSRS